MPPADIVAAADRVVYACRPYTDKGTRMTCTDCGSPVGVTPSVLADRRAKVEAAGRTLEVVCDDCAFAYAASRDAPLFVAMPTADEIEQANS